MKIDTGKSFSLIPLLFVLIFSLPLSATAQNRNDDRKIVVEPSSLSLKVDEQANLRANVFNANGTATGDRVIFFSRNDKSVEVTRDGLVTAHLPGTFEIIALAVGNSGRITTRVKVDVAYPPLKTIKFVNMPENIYAGTTIPVEFEAIDAKGLKRENANVTLSTSDRSVAEIDPYGRLKAKKPGPFTLRARGESVTISWNGRVRPNPVSSINLQVGATEVRTGDVVRFNARALNARGGTVADAPITYSFISNTDDQLGEGASAQIEQDGRFVANKPGLYTVIAKSGSSVSEQSIRVNPRNVRKKISVVGHGKVLDKHTSDLWVWEGVDGRDYAVTGTWGAAGEAFFWDVTDPANMQIIDTVTVDARTVNDVKVSEDGRLAVITREGASDRKNGIVILDVSNPHNVSIISEYSRGLTGGVHNAFIWNSHVFAVNNGRRYDIINIEDPENPRTVSRFELDTPGHSVHDVWVENGIAYSSNWDDGVVITDVGSTARANSPEKHDIGVGSPENPVKLGSYAYPSGWNHAAFPFKSRSTGDFYVLAGDEAFPNGLPTRNNPVAPAGWIHFIKFDGGWDRPIEVARYQVPEAGTHNMWVKNDTLYVGYYNAGLRVVDISGELMGNLYDQGREIAKFEPNHPDAIIPNSPFTWGPQPHKGHIFISDWNSGLWALKLQDPRSTDAR